MGILVEIIFSDLLLNQAAPNGIEDNTTIEQGSWVVRQA